MFPMCKLKISQVVDDRIGKAIHPIHSAVLLAKKQQRKACIIQELTTCESILKGRILVSVLIGMQGSPPPPPPPPRHRHTSGSTSTLHVPPSALQRLDDKRCVADCMHEGCRNQFFNVGQIVYSAFNNQEMTREISNNNRGLSRMLHVIVVHLLRYTRRGQQFSPYEINKVL